MTSPPAPKVDEDPVPPVIWIRPPAWFAALLCPAVNCISPPRPVLVTPTDIIRSPAFPLVADPEAIRSAPDAPELVVPVRNFSSPLTPVVPAFEVETLSSPLVV